MIKRELEQVLKNDAQSMPVITVIGPRQSGKTTLVKATFSNYAYFNLEDPSLRESIRLDPKAFIYDQTKPVIIDEIQYLPELLSYIQAKVDEKVTPGQFILTGSQNLNIKATISQSLAGRTAIRYLFPLSVSEIPREVETDDLLVKGFYPVCHMQQSNPEWLNWYIQTYMEKDVFTLIKGGNWGNFHRFLRLCAARAGHLVNANSMSIEIGVDYKTIQSWMDMLEQSFIIFRLPPYYKNYNKRVIKTPKLYFYDIGIVTSLLGIKTRDDARYYYQKGELFENMVIADLMKSISHRGFTRDVHFWRSRTQKEIDCLIGPDHDLRVIEIKAGKTFRKDFINNLQFWKKLETEHQNRSYCVYDGDLEQMVQGIRLINWRHASDVIFSK